MTPRLKWVFAKAATVYKGQRETPRYEEVVSSSDRIVVHRFHGSLGSVRQLRQRQFVRQRSRSTAGQSSGSMGSGSGSGSTMGSGSSSDQSMSGQSGTSGSTDQNGQTTSKHKKHNEEHQ